MILTVKRSGRALLRRARTGIRLAGLALDRHHEFGLRGIAVRAAGRSWSTASEFTRVVAERTPEPKAGFDAIYAIGYWPGQSKRYRVLNMVEELQAAGYSVHVMPFDRLDDVRRHHWRGTALVLFRAEYDQLAGIGEVLAYARRIGMRVVYDIDDLVFDPDLVDRIDGLALMGPHERHQFVSGIARRRRLLTACDLVTVTTAPLARAAAALGRPAAVIPNSLNQAQLRLAAEIASQPRVKRDAVWIGYFSGTRTHQRDFAVCETALLGIINRHPEARFRAVGHLELGPEWQRYRDRVERVGLLEPDDMLRLMAATDINLAPLELGNPFCEAKSELKFFEAAAVGVPTVASGTEPFLDAIEGGVSGFVVRDSEGWQDAIERLLASSSYRRKVGAAAKARALLRYGPGATIPALTAALGLQPLPDQLH